MRLLLFTLLALVLPLSLAAGGASDAAPARPAALAPDRTGIATTLQNAPIMFIENAGQFDARARFQVRGGAGGGTLWLAEDALWVTLLERPRTDLRSLGNLRGLRHEGQPRQGVNLKLSFVGANPHPHLEPFNRLDTHVSYFTGNDPARWRADVPVWGGVRYVNLYPGVDLEVGGDLAGPRLITRPGADLSAVRLRVEGADTITLKGNRLHLTTAVGAFSLPLFQVAEASDPLREGIRGEGPEVRANQITAPFALGKSANTPSQDHPADLLYSTFLGGNGWDFGDDIVVNSSGEAYVTGITGSSDFPTTPGAFQTTPAGDYDVFVTRLNAVGSAPVYSTFLGGSNWDVGSGIAVDASGDVYITGSTGSPDFPTTAGAFQATCEDCPDHSDAFVAKLNATGSALVYSTLLGGEDDDAAHAIAVDASGSAYITGNTHSPDFPTTPEAFQITYRGNYDAFIAKLNAAGSELAYSTFLGGSGTDAGNGIAVNANGAAYITGQTWSSDFPTTPGAFQTTYQGGDYDAFVTGLDATGSTLAYSTFLGGSYADEGHDVALDTSGEASIAGDTESADFPTTPGAFQTIHGGGTCGAPPHPYPCPDAFVARLNAAGSGLVFAGFLGGNDADSGGSIVLDVTGATYVSGYTSSLDFPTTPGAIQPAHGGGTCGLPPNTYPCPDAFVTRLNPAGSTMMYSTYLGGNDQDVSTRIALDAGGVAYITGYTQSVNFPTTAGAFQPYCEMCPGYSAFISKLVPAATSYRIYFPLSAMNR